jgi:hypothetical protein
MTNRFSNDTKTIEHGKKISSNNISVTVMETLTKQKATREVL